MRRNQAGRKKVSRDARYVSFVEHPMVSALTDDHDGQKDGIDVGDAR
jgi:hypothetical protein